MVIIVPEGDEETGAWRKLHNEELHNLYASLNVSTMIKLKMRQAGLNPTSQRICRGKKLENALGTAGRRRDDNTKIDRKEKGFRHNEELHNLYSSIIRMIKRRRVKWAGNVARIGKMMN
jgi:hypothetical protein